MTRAQRADLVRERAARRHLAQRYDEMAAAYHGATIKPTVDYEVKARSQRKRIADIDRALSFPGKVIFR